MDFLLPSGIHAFHNSQHVTWLAKIHPSQGFPNQKSLNQVEAIPFKKDILPIKAKIVPTPIAGNSGGCQKFPKQWGK
jgi:hypothetical protein